MTESSKGQWLCSLAMVLVGSTVVVSRVLGAQVDPFLATALRHALALPVFLSIAAWRGVRFTRPGWHDAGWLLLQALSGSVGYTVLLIEGVQRCGAADAAVVAGTLPLVAAGFSVAVLGERPGWRLALAVLLATLGVLALGIAPAPAAGAPQRGRGIALVLAAVACEAVFILANRRLSRPLPPLALSTWMSAGGLVLATLAVPLRTLPAQVAALPPSAWLAIVHYALGPTVIGFLLWYEGSRRTSGTRAALATAWMPVAALLMAVAWLGEPVTVAQLSGLALVVAGVGLAGTGAAAEGGANGRARAGASA